MPVFVYSKMEKNMARKITINDCNNMAQSRGGRCVSKVYTTKKHNMMWECQFGHTWGATYDKICLGRWCHICSKTNRYNLHDVKNVALKYNKPVIFGVLTTLNLQQALDRAGGKHGNKGDEASATAIKMLGF